MVNNLEWEKRPYSYYECLTEGWILIRVYHNPYNTIKSIYGYEVNKGETKRIFNNDIKHLKISLDDFFNTDKKRIQCNKKYCRDNCNNCELNQYINFNKLLKDCNVSYGGVKYLDILDNNNFLMLAGKKPIYIKKK